jgi:FecR protein
MKHFGSRMSKWTVYAVALLTVALVATTQAKEGTARVMAIRGTADYSVGGATWQKLNVGKVLHSGASIRTGAESQVDLFLKQNGPVVRVTAETTLGLDTLLYEQTGDETVITTKLDLKNGRIQGNVKKLAAASKYQVQIPSGVVGIRGTDYDISADGWVSIIEGEALLEYTVNGQMTQHTINQGQTFNPETGNVGNSPTEGPHTPLSPPPPPTPLTGPVAVVPVNNINPSAVTGE